MKSSEIERSGWSFTWANRGNFMVLTNPLTPNRDYLLSSLCFLGSITVPVSACANLSGGLSIGFDLNHRFFNGDTKPHSLEGFEPRTGNKLKRSSLLILMSLERDTNFFCLPSAV